MPLGHRFRDRQILFDEEEFDAIRSYATHVEPLDDGARQLRLFRNGTAVAGKTRLNQIGKAGTNGEAQAVVLLSGGLDSTTVLAIACIRASRSTPCRSATDNGIRSSSKRRDGSPRTWCGSARHLRYRSAQFGGSALTDDIDVPKDRPAEAMADEIPRDLRSCAQHDLPVLRAGVGRGARRAGHLHRRERAGLQRLSRLPAGVHRGLSSRWPNLATKAGVEGRQHLTIHTPLIHLTKAEIIETGLELGVDYSLTSTLLRPAADGRPAGSATRASCGSRGLQRTAWTTRSVRDDRASNGGLTMTYAVKEIYYTLQGEGANRTAGGVSAASPAATSGRDVRATARAAVCRFCDTDFVGTDGPGGGKFVTPADCLLPQ